MMRKSLTRPLRTAASLAAIATLLTLGGCAVPTQKPPAVELPENWGQGTSAAKLSGDWWKLYNDPVLDALVGEGFEHNRDLALAVARVDEARALVRVARAQLFPTVDLTAGVNRTRNSALGPVPLPASAINVSDFSAQFNVAYELDLWGRLRGGVKAAQAELLATEGSRDTVRIALAAEVVRDYYNLRALDEQVGVTRRTLALREEDLRLQRVRAKAGLTGDFQLRQLEAEAEAARAQIPAIERSLKTAELALATLLGRSPRAIMQAAITRGTASDALAPVMVPQGLPSDLLLRRPDIMQAEQLLVAAGARISVARASLFPQIGLSGFLGSESLALQDFLSAPSRMWQYGLTLAQPIFQAGRAQAEVAAARAREQQAVLQYQQAVQQAFREVADALSTQARSREVFEAESARVQMLTDALRLARIRFDNGLISQLEIIDAERNLLAAQLNRIDALRAQRVALADLSRALGGGWTAPAGAATVPRTAAAATSTSPASAAPAPTSTPASTPAPTLTPAPAPATPRAAAPAAKP